MSRWLSRVIFHDVGRCALVSGRCGFERGVVGDVIDWLFGVPSSGRIGHFRVIIGRVVRDSLESLSDSIRSSVGHDDVMTTRSPLCNQLTKQSEFFLWPLHVNNVR